MTRTFLVTGGTGMVGRHVVATLRQAGAHIRVLTRSGRVTDDGVDYRTGDTTDPIVMSDALHGVDGVFLLWPSFDTTNANAVARAIANACGHVVYLSTNGVPDDRLQASPLFHATVENALQDTGLSTTMLRPTGFANNVTVWADQIQRGDVVRWPFAQARRSLIHERDIGEVAAACLLDEVHRQQKYLLTGPQSLTQAHQVETIGKALGRALRFEELSPEIARAQLTRDWGDAGFVDAALSGWAAMVDEPEPVTDTVLTLLGRQALTFAQWCDDHRQDFMDQNVGR
jgi:uncharacterized protein YbjT (DUF2867 family)